MKERLLELARIGAREQHEEAFAMEDDFDERDVADGHTRLFDSCPHPDCVLVRGGSVPAPVKETVETLDIGDYEDLINKFDKFMRDATNARRRQFYDSEESFRNKANEVAQQIVARFRFFGRGQAAIKEVMSPVESMQLPDAVGGDKQTPVSGSWQSANAGVTHPATNTSDDSQLAALLLQITALRDEWREHAQHLKSSPEYRLSVSATVAGVGWLLECASKLDTLLSGSLEKTTP